MKISNLFPAAAFTAFVLWLLAVAMDGPLSESAGIANGANFFLPAHIGSLLMIGLFCPRKLLFRLLPAGCVVTAAAVIALPLTDPETGRYALALMGGTGGFVAVGACVMLRQSPNPLLSAALGLTAANILLIPLGMYPEAEAISFAAVAAGLLLIPVMERRLPEAGLDPEAETLWHYLPFIFLFQIVSGLMYAYIMPAYGQLAVLPGADLFFYIAGAWVAMGIVVKNRDLAMITGVILGMAAFSILQAGTAQAPVNAGMFAIMGAAGMIDMVFLAILLSFPEPKKAFGVGLAIFCAGILSGKVIGQYFIEMAGAIALTGHVVLNVSVVVLYIIGRWYIPERKLSVEIPEPAHVPEEARGIPPEETRSARKEHNRAASPPTAGDTNPDAPEAPRDVVFDENLRLLLSEREYDVLMHVFRGWTYRESAAELGISESTVKTYMYRIYEKMGVRGKKQLFEKLTRFWHSSGNPTPASKEKK